MSWNKVLSPYGVSMLLIVCASVLLGFVVRDMLIGKKIVEAKRELVGTTTVLRSQDVKVGSEYTMVTMTLCVDGEKVFVADGVPLLLRGPCDSASDGKWPGR